MKTAKRTIAAFDFDGTLTTRDTLPLFIIHAKGWRCFMSGMVRITPMLCRYLLGIIPNSEAKQCLFAHFFKGMPYKDFCFYGNTFSDKIEKILDFKNFRLLQQHTGQEHSVCIVSASIKEWIQPWANRYGVNKVIATEAETDENGVLTGRFLSPNCNGKEKVRRLLEEEPDRENYYLYAYGDSKGDIPLLEYADKGIMNKKYNLLIFTTMKRIVTFFILLCLLQSSVLAQISKQDADTLVQTYLNNEGLDSVTWLYSKLPVHPHFEMRMS